MSIHLQENQYRGINAHLHSYLQQHGDWSMFHGEHITHLREALQAKLPPETGYFVVAEKSLQVVRDELMNLYTARRTTLSVLPDYPHGENHAYPYVILVSSPYPTVGDGKTEIYGFRVDDPLPIIRIPLDQGDSISFDLGKVYHHTFAQNVLYGLRIVDYAVLPENFSSYDSIDRARIEAVMQRASEGVV